MSNQKVLDDLDVIGENNRLARVMAESWINELKEFGYSYDEMIPIFRLAKHKADILIQQKK